MTTPGTFETERERATRAFERLYSSMINQLSGNNMTHAARLAGVGRGAWWRICNRAGTLPDRSKNNSTRPVRAKGVRSA